MIRNFLIVFFSVCALLSKGQDMHLSQFYSVPLHLNPALTGSFPCDLRFGLNYRSQWANISPIRTQAAWGDGKLNQHILKNDWFGVGGMIYGDQAGGGTFKNTKFMASAAYHKGLFRNNMFNTSIGASLGFVNRSASTGDFVFDSQWNGSTFSPSAASGENLVDNSFYFFDINAGILLEFKKSKYNAYLGGSLNHLNMPNITFYGKKVNMGIRSVLHGGGSVKLRSLKVNPQFMFSNQSGAKEFVFGANAVYNYAGLVDLYFGLWDRFSGDLIPTIGLDYKGWLILFNYDVNYSAMRAVTSFQGGWELSLTKTFGCGNGSGVAGGSGRGPKKGYCPAYDK